MLANQEIVTTALRTEAAKALSDASYAVRTQNAGMDEVREYIKRALTALEMSLPVVAEPATNLVRVR